MKVNVAYFAIYQELMERENESLELEEGTTVGELFDQRTRHLKDQESLLKSTLFAVNSDYSPIDQVLNEGDEVVFIPPVSGG